MAGYKVCCFSLGNVGASNNEGDVDIFLVAAFFTYLMYKFECSIE